MSGDKTQPLDLPEWFARPEKHPDYVDSACDDLEEVLGWKCTYIDLLKGLVKDLAALRSPRPSLVSPPPDLGEVSDGYHTFNELYEHRHALFAVACAFLGGWKSKLHDDGTMFPGWFIAGLTTSDGPATYHLPIRLWERFPGRELAKAPAWDGHTASDVIGRLWAHVSALAAPSLVSPPPDLAASIQAIKASVQKHIDQDSVLSPSGPTQSFRAGQINVCDQVLALLAPEGESDGRGGMGKEGGDHG